MTVAAAAEVRATVSTVTPGRPLVSAGARLAHVEADGPALATPRLRDRHEDAADKAVVQPSMYESCLQVWAAGRPEPAMISVQCIEDALQRDRVNHIKKYRGREANSRTARFTVELPVGPQHMKFSTRRGGRQLAADSRRVALPEPAAEEQQPPQPSSQYRFNMETLRKWFKEIDARRCGSVTQRELIVALRQRKDLQAVLCVVNGLDVGEPGVPGGAEASTEARREEVRRIKKIWDDVNSKDSESIDWDEFVDFFRRAGLLLEYRAHTGLSARSSNCRKSFALQAQHTEAKAVRKERDRRISELQQKHRETRHISTVMSCDLAEQLQRRMAALAEESHDDDSSGSDEDC